MAINRIARHLSRWFLSNDSGALDRHLQSASNHADVEHRLRQWESRDRGGLRLP